MHLNTEEIAAIRRMIELYRQEDCLYEGTTKDMMREVASHHQVKDIEAFVSKCNRLGIGAGWPD